MVVRKAISRPNYEQALLTLPIQCAPLTREYDSPSFLATRFGLEAIWRVDTCRHMVVHAMEMHWNTCNKITISVWGTWDSNPGPMGFGTNALPMYLVVSGIGNGHYI